MPRRNHKPKRKSRKPLPHPALEKADPTLIDSRILAELAKKPPKPDSEK